MPAMRVKSISKGRKVLRRKVEGEALVNINPISFMREIDIRTGMICEKKQQLYGKSIKDKTPVFLIGKGSTSGSYMPYDMCTRGIGPRGIINLKAESVVVGGSIISKLPRLVNWKLTS